MHAAVVQMTFLSAALDFKQTLFPPFKAKTDFVKHTSSINTLLARDKIWTLNEQSLVIWGIHADWQYMLKVHKCRDNDTEVKLKYYDTYTKRVVSKNKIICSLIPMQPESGKHVSSSCITDHRVSRVH